MATRLYERATVKAVLAALLLAVLVACGGGTQPPAKGRLAGTVVVGSPLGGTALQPLVSTDSAELGSATVVDNTPLDPATIDFVPGELIVGFKEVAGVSAAAVVADTTMLEAAGVQMAMVRPFSAITAGLYRAPGLDKAETVALAEALRARPDVAYADLNRIYQPLAVPNDPGYTRQWHLPAIDMAGAWDVSTGSSDVVVGVLDTGILYSMTNASLRHPDLVGRVVQGYDFVTNLTTAADGDGRDADPYDPVASEQYHGSHVAGTIGAASNNGVGVTGVDWNAKILPVRVMGSGGGAWGDIIDGLLWASGSSVDEVPTNANPADVINLSLGGSGACDESFQALLDFVSIDTIVVVAAGNSNANASDFAPAGCAGVITVGATDVADERSWFSNYGSRIDVMAPGGDISEDLDDDGFPDGVLSLGYTSTFNYSYLQGTSMAAPHVAGVVALMKAIDPTVDTATALAALRASATPLSDAACNGYGPDSGPSLTSLDCGAGLINAALALSYIEAGEIPNQPGALLRFAPSALEFGATTTRIDFSVTNISGSTLDWSLTNYLPATDNPGTIDAAAFIVPTGSPNVGTLLDGESVNTAIVIDRDELSADGNYQIRLIFDIDGGVDEELLLMRFTKTSTVTPTLSGPMLVAAYIEDEFGNILTSGYQSSSGVISSFDFEVEPGQNLLAAWADKNDNAVVDDGDLFGVYPSLLDVARGVRLSGLIVPVDPFFGNSPDAHSWVIKDLQRLSREASGVPALPLEGR